VFTSVEFSTLCQDRLLSWERKLSMLVGFMSRKVLVLWCLLAEGGIMVKKIDEMVTNVRYDCSYIAIFKGIRVR
jgi:hypothetical protein